MRKVLWPFTNSIWNTKMVVWQSAWKTPCQVLNFLLFDRNEYINTESSGLCNSGWHTYVTGLFHFSLFFKIWLAESILISWEWLFKGTCLLLASFFKEGLILLCQSIFFNCHLAAPQPTLGHSQGDSLTNLMLIIAFYLCQPEGPREPRNKVGSLSPAERLARFELGTFQF